MRLLTCLLALGLSTSALAGGDPCKKARRTADAISGEETVQMSVMTWTDNWTFEKGPGGFKLWLYASVPGVNERVVAPGYPLQLKLADGTLFDLATSMESLPQKQVIGDSVRTGWRFLFPLTPEQIKAMGASPITAWRFGVEPEVRSGLVEGGFGKGLTAATTCMATL